MADNVAFVVPQIEEANAKRIGYVAELAAVRKTTLPVLLKELGLKPVAHA